MKKMKGIMIMLLLSLSLASIAQETTSEISGIVLDANSSLPGVNITAIHVPTGTKYFTTTRKDGRYNLPNLKVGGPYTVTASFVGYNSNRQSDIMLNLGQTFEQNFKLVESDNTKLSEVTVKATKSKVFNSSRTGSQEIISRSTIEQLPTISRSWKDMIKLVPAQNNSSFGGISSQLNNLTIDGANFNNSFGLSDAIGGQTGAQPISLDAIEQIQVNVSPYDVKYGGFNGAGINTVTRSGKNQVFGSVYDYVKSKDLQSYKVGDVSLAKQDFNYNLFGFTAGGAIIKNKLFFFINGETEKKVSPGTSWQASNSTNTPNGVNYSNANANKLDSLANFLKSKYGYDPGNYQGYSYTAESKRLTVKIDWNINEKNTFSFKYNLLRSSNQIKPSDSGSSNTSYGRTPGQYAMPFYGAGYQINNNADIFIAELNSRFSNTINNKVQVGYTKLRDFRKSLSSQDFPLVDILDGNGQPFTSFGYEQYTYGNKLNTDVIQFNDVLNIYVGSHEITLGTQNSYKVYSNGFSPSYEGVYRFNSLADFYASTNGTKAAARYDLSYTLGGGDFPLVGPKDLELSAFAQDKWKIKDNFTLTYGVRFDYTKFYDTFLYNPVVDTLSNFYNGIHANTGLAPYAAIQVSPRLGFNWDVLKDRTLQVRGGTGLFQGPPPFVWISNQASNSGMALFGSISNGTGYKFSPDINAYRPTSSGTLSSSYSINVTDPNFKFPQVWKSTLAVDKKLFGWTVTVEGTYISNINASVFQNIALPSTGLITLSDGRVRFPYKSAYPIAGKPTSASNPSIGNAIYMTNANAGYTMYGTLQIQRQFKDLYVSVAYTRMTAKDAAVSGSTASTMWGSKMTSGNSNDFNIGNSNNYIPHRIIANINYKKEWSKMLTTSVGLLYEAAPNYATSVIYSGDLNNDGFNNDLMYVPKNSSDIKLTQANGGDTRTTAEIWTQLDNFINNSPYFSKHRGEIVERNAMVLPWTNRVDLNFTQDINFKVNNNKHTLKLTADIFNLTNLLNSNWGVNQLPTTTAPLTFVKMDTDGKTPIFSFPYLDAANKTPYSKPFKNDIGLGSRFQIQIGVRYLFN
ncbi:TonB-dependent receptor plug [Paludibacter propionicigenes WB4]|uniref:TonB-dependent receptor plug n=1 Tax=Paludibacter propionicigenes (strain DSM 17365 / JCM 13257 / WB4) TaxID=694427 RepID=E4T2M7_PALPW|nr:carboxypeptidase regulatory-like domain-containing protein [Paludibacter propionicigenes]ADQ78971.1 TonB-dependent receptor plug [Paludibacter propionicigenes WB4]